MGTNIEGMRRRAPRDYVPSKRIKSLHRIHRKHGGTLSLKAFARERAGMIGASLPADWLSRKRRA